MYAFVACGPNINCSIKSKTKNYGWNLNKENDLRPLLDFYFTLWLALKITSKIEKKNYINLKKKKTWQNYSWTLSLYCNKHWKTKDIGKFITTRRWRYYNAKREMSSCKEEGQTKNCKWMIRSKSSLAKDIFWWWRDKIINNNMWDLIILDRVVTR